MKIILDRYKKYYPEYDPATKILQLHGKIPVVDFVALRVMITYIKEEVKDIRVN